MFVVLPCFSGMIELRRGTTAPAIFSGGGRSLELHQGRGAASRRATGVEPADPGLGGRDRGGSSAPQPTRCRAYSGRKTLTGGVPRGVETRRCVRGKSACPGSG